MTKEVENTPFIGRPPGSPNKRNQELYHLAEREKIDIVLIKLLLAGLKFEKLGYTKEQIAELTIKDLVEIQSRNANDLLPYYAGKRKPVDSDGNDAANPIEDLLNELNESRT